MEIVLRSQDFPHKTAKDVCVWGGGTCDRRIEISAGDFLSSHFVIKIP